MKTENIFGRRIRGSGLTIESKHNNNNPLGYEYTIEILDSRYVSCDGISADGVKVNVDEKDEKIQWSYLIRQRRHMSAQFQVQRYRSMAS